MRDAALDREGWRGVEGVLVAGAPSDSLETEVRLVLVQKVKTGARRAGQASSSLTARISGRRSRVGQQSSGKRWLFRAFAGWRKAFSSRQLPDRENPAVCSEICPCTSPWATSEATCHPRAKFMLSEISFHGSD